MGDTEQPRPGRESLGECPEPLAARYDLAMLDLAVLWVVVVLTARAFHAVRPLAGWLLVPYLAWITFAGALNLFIWLRNG